MTTLNMQRPHTSISIANKIKSADLIHSIFQSAYRVEADLIGVQSLPPLERIVSEIRASENTFYAAMQDDTCLGIMEIEKSKETTVIVSLAVRPFHSRQGVGRLLVQFILEQNSSVVVTTAEKNLPAINLYEKLGFTKTNEFSTSEGIRMVELDARLPTS